MIAPVPNGGWWTWKPGHNSAPPDTGRVAIGRDSSLRKLMRAARRGKLPEERMGTIQDAMRRAAARQP